MRQPKKCNACEVSKLVKSYGFCDPCYKKLKRQTDPLFFLKHLHSKLKQRCTNPNEKYSAIYFGKQYCDQKTFLDKFKNNSQYLEVFFKWVHSGWSKNMAPSVDRIENAGDYIIENLQILQMGVNCIKDKPMLQVDVYNKKKGSFVNTYNSIADASRALGVNQTTISRVVAGRGNSAGGYIFKRKE